MNSDNKPPDNEDSFIRDYQPLFELGIIRQNPAIKILSDMDVCPVALAALTTAMFEAVMRIVPENKQNEFEDVFKKSFKTLMKERHNYDMRFVDITSTEEDTENEDDFFGDDEQ